MIVAIIAFKGKFLEFGKQLHQELILLWAERAPLLIQVHYYHCMFVFAALRITKKTDHSSNTSSDYVHHENRDDKADEQPISLCSKQKICLNRIPKER